MKLTRSSPPASETMENATQNAYSYIDAVLCRDAVEVLCARGACVAHCRQETKREGGERGLGGMCESLLSRDKTKRGSVVRGGAERGSEGGWGEG